MMRVPETSRRFSLRTLLVGVALCAGALGGYRLLFPDPLTALFGGRIGLRTVREPTKVEIYRLGDLPGWIGEDAAAPDDFPVVAGPVLASAATAHDLSQALLSDSSYEWGWAAACGYPVYGVKLSFYRGGDRVDVYVCFKCRHLAVLMNGEQAGGVLFSGIRAVLVRTAKDAFPDDAVIQSL